MKRNFLQPAEILALSILISVAAFFRFFRLQETLVFQGDEGRALLAARDILAGHLTLVGPETSIPGFHLGPFFYYLLAPVLWLAQYNPLGPAALMACFGIATVIVLFMYGRKFFSFESGLAMGLFYALSPHAIWQSRIALEPSPVPFFSILWLYAITSWLKERKTFWLLLSLGCILIGIQLNFSCIALLPATLWLMIPSLPLSERSRTLLKVGSLVLLIPMLLVRTVLRPTTPWPYFESILGRLFVPGHPSVVVAVMSVLLVALGAFLARKKIVRVPHSAFPAFAWIVFCSASFILKYVSGDHSLALLFPAPSVLLGMGLFIIAQRATRLHSMVLAALSVAILFLCWNSYTYLTDQPSGEYRQLQNRVAFISKLSEGKPFRFMYRGHLDVYEAVDDHYQYIFWKNGTTPVQSYRREIAPETLDQWNTHMNIRPELTIVLYQLPFNFSEYSGYHMAEEQGSVWIAVEENPL